MFTEYLYLIHIKYALLGYYGDINGLGGQPHIPTGALYVGKLPPPSGIVCLTVLDTRPSSSLFTKPPIFVGGFVVELP